MVYHVSPLTVPLDIETVNVVALRESSSAASHIPTVFGDPGSVSPTGEALAGTALEVKPDIDF